MSRTRRIHVIGAGGHGKVVVRTLQELGHEVAAVFDDNPRLWGASLFGAPVVGPVERILDFPRLPAVVAVGDNEVRAALVLRYSLDWMTAVHPTAFVDSTARLGPGTIVLAKAAVQVDAEAGEHVIVNTAASIDHDCRLGDFVHAAPGVHLAGGVAVGNEVLLGVGAVAIPSVRIGAGTTVGAGGVVVSDLPDRVVALGVPARIVGSAGRKPLLGVTDASLCAERSFSSARPHSGFDPSAQPAMMVPDGGGLQG